MSKKVLIFKNDRTGDLFVSLNAINKIINKHSNDHIDIFLSDVNHKFSFLFPTINKKILSMKLSITNKLKIFFYLLLNNVETVYILTPKQFYYFLPFFFRKIKFYAITIKSIKSRPSNFFAKYLYKYSQIDRINIKKRKSSYEIQSELIDTDLNKNYLNNDFLINHSFNYPKNFVFFHYKRNLFENLLKWNLETTCKFLDFLNTKYENILFSSELNDKKINDFFSSKFNTYDYNNGKEKVLNKKGIFFLKNIDGFDLFDAVKKSSKIISPEGIITHMGYYLNKPILALMHFNLYNRQDFINQIISCKEWFPPKNYNFIVLKKDFDKSVTKLLKRI